MNRKQLANALVPVVDVVLVIVAVPAALFMKWIRRLGLGRLPITRAALLRIGVLPIRNHYYEPYLDPRELKKPLDSERPLPGIDLNVAGQLQFLSTLNFKAELSEIASPSRGPNDFRLGNMAFESGDAEFLYQVIRRLKPGRVFEIGSGHSTLMARAAIQMNGRESADYVCRHVCIEPYEMPWLEATGVEVVRKRVEDVDVAFFQELERNDLLFIDSSHVIRPQGDVVTEYLQILPILRSGVVVHIHDVFTPRDYLEEWVVQRMMLWNEQYLLEALLTDSDRWTIVGAVNFLKHRYFAELLNVCPYLTADREPGSFYIQRR